MREHTAYILKHLLAAAAAVAVALTGAVWLSQSLRFLDFIIDKGLSLFAFLRLTLLLLPQVLTVVLPFATLCATIYVYGRLTGDRELIVLRAAGVSPWGLAKPALALGALATAAGLLLSLWLMPAGFRNFKDEQAFLRADFSHVLMREGVFNEMMDGLTVYVRARGEDGRLLGILAHDNRDPAVTVTMMAEWGALMGGPRGSAFLLGRGNRQEVGRGGRALRMLYFDSYVLELEALGQAPGNRIREAKERYLHELVGAPATAYERQHRDELLAEAHRRLAAPFNALALAAIGLAAMLAGEFDRRRQWPRIAWGAGCGLVYLAAAFTLAGMTTRTPALAAALYLLPVVCTVLALLVMSRQSFARRARAAPSA